MDRKLDGIYFRVKRDNKYTNVCFSDLTKAERDEVCKGRSTEWYRDLAYHLADKLKEVGDTFDLLGGQ